MKRLALAALFLLAGCGRQANPPAASSSFSHDAALALAGRISQSVVPPLSFGTIQATGSMKPTLDERTVVLYEPYLGQPLKVGDIVEFARGPQRVLHRVVEVRRNGVVTRGDNNDRDDGLIPFSQITRRYVGQIVSR